MMLPLVVFLFVTGLIVGAYFAASPGSANRDLDRRLQEIFLFEKMGVSQDGKVIGRFRATGVRPKCCERLKASGIHIPADMFEGVTEVR